MEPVPVQAPLAVHDYGTITDEPLPPRQIPAHLQKPLAPRTARQPARPEAEQPAATAAPKRSLFNIVAGKIRSSMPMAAPAAEAPAMPERVEVAREVQISDPSRRSAAEEAGIEIPTFLRRQSS
jgi:pyruvate/2-oxoglutarate dehydrogenase complex dihydrolipoamide acyltransferase (E2) component